MNGKKAKALRQHARSLAPGLPQKQYGMFPGGRQVILFRCWQDYYRRLKRGGTPHTLSHTSEES